MSEKNYENCTCLHPITKRKLFMCGTSMCESFKKRFMNGTELHSVPKHYDEDQDSK